MTDAAQLRWLVDDLAQFADRQQPKGDYIALGSEE